MSFDINKPFTRRDGKKVLWWKILEGTYNGLPLNKVVYAIETANGNHILQKVDAATGLEYTPESMRESDLINTPQYMYRAEWLNDGGTVNCGPWFDSLDALRAAHENFPHEIRRRPADSIHNADYELNPADLEDE